MSKILFFGDVFGKPGRQALARVLPSLRDEYEPDVVIANVENLAHGKGVTPPTMKEMSDLGIDVFTSGNHVFDKNDLSEECFKLYPNLIRPANYEGTYPGFGFYRLVKDKQHYLIINLNGQVFFENQFRGTITSPFSALDSLLVSEAQKDDIIVVDLHADATSEKIAFGWHADGRITALIGTHTHVPTADARILPKGTAYVTDAGMCGPMNSVIGASIETTVNSFVRNEKFKLEVAEGGLVVVNGVYIETEGNKAIKIEKIQRQVDL